MGLSPDADPRHSPPPPWDDTLATGHQQEKHEEAWWGEDAPEEDEELLAFYQDANNDASRSSEDEEAVWIYAEGLSRELEADEVEMSWMAFAEAKRALYQAGSRGGSSEEARARRRGLRKASPGQGCGPRESR